MKNLSNLCILIIITILVIFVNRKFFPSTEIEEVIKVDTLWVTKVDTIIKTKLVPKYIELPSDTIYIPQDCDSLKVMYNDLYTLHNTKKTYLMSEKLDSIGTIEVTTKLFKNNIEEQKIIYNYKIPQISIIKEIYPQQCHFYMGLIVQKNGVSPNILYIRPKINISLQYDIINKQPSIGVGYKLFSYGKKSK